LSENPNITVLLLEAGGQYDLKEVPLPIALPLLFRSKLSWNYFTTEQKQSHFGFVNKTSHWPRGKTLGGSSTINAMMYIRGNKNDYDRWAQNGCDGWSYDEVLPYFIKSENNLRPSLRNDQISWKFWTFSDFRLFTSSIE